MCTGLVAHVPIKEMEVGLSTAPFLLGGYIISVVHILLSLPCRTGQSLCCAILSQPSEPCLTV